MKDKTKKGEKKVELSDREIAEIQGKKKQARIRRCAEKLQALLKEENCELDVSVVVTAKGNFPQLNIIAK